MRLFDLSNRLITLNSQGKYCALSYVWGESDMCTNHNIGGVTWAVPKSAINILEALNSKKIKDYIENLIWCDSVCINQNDPQDKNIELEHMGKIYSESSLTVVWLVGTSIPIHSCIKKLEALDVIHNNTINIPKILNLDFECMRNLHELLIEACNESTWAERVWTLQEALLSSNLIFVFSKDIGVVESNQMIMVTKLMSILQQTGALTVRWDGGLISLTNVISLRLAYRNQTNDYIQKDSYVFTQQVLFVAIASRDSRYLEDIIIGTAAITK